jgi:hypothetical protein
MHYRTTAIILCVITSVICSTGDAGAQPEQKSDSGYYISGPRKVIKTKRIKPDVFITAFTQDGVIITDNTGSPWFNATLFAHGSILTDSTGKELKEVVIFEACDKDGDLNWSVLHYPDGNRGPGTFELVQGTGKWAGIKGTGKIIGRHEERADGFIMPDYNIQWEIDPVNAPNSDQIPGKEKYKYSDQCLSFHGPHVFLLSKDLSNGISLEFSTQSGVLMSLLDPGKVSPRNNATCFDRGNTVKLDGKTLGDIMLLEDTDQDGDVVWLLHIWWYNKGPGSYEFIDGIGKWEGISGTGVTRGMYKNRTDDHFMLKSELVWNLPADK